MVWVDDRQMQCCGDTFTVGGRIGWTLTALTPAGWDMVLGQGRGAPRRVGDDAAVISGTVASIEAGVWCWQQPEWPALVVVGRAARYARDVEPVFDGSAPAPVLLLASARSTAAIAGFAAFTTERVAATNQPSSLWWRPANLPTPHRSAATVRLN